MKAMSKRIRVWSLISLGAMVTMLIMSLAMPFFLTPVMAQEATKAATEAAPKVEMAKDVYFKIEGPVSGNPAPELKATDYPSYNLPYPLSENRIWIWSIAQQHLYFAVI